MIQTVLAVTGESEENGGFVLCLVGAQDPVDSGENPVLIKTSSVPQQCLIHRLSQPACHSDNNCRRAY